MRWTTIPSGHVAGVLLAASQAMAACPYANQLGARSETLEEISNPLLQVPDAQLRGRKAEGKKGVFFM